MDWSNVTADDLIEALREVDWSSPPRPYSDFFSRFTFSRSLSKWISRLNYRTNYFMMIVLILEGKCYLLVLSTFRGKWTQLVLGLGFIRSSLAIVAALTMALSIALLNDRPVIRRRPSAKRAIYICGRPRWVFVFVFTAVSSLLWFVSCGLISVLWALAIGLIATLIHASFRTPNLKARLNTFREEFHAFWRNYSEL